MYPPVLLQKVSVWFRACLLSWLCEVPLEQPLPVDGRHVWGGNLCADQGRVFEQQGVFPRTTDLERNVGRDGHIITSGGQTNGVDKVEITQ